MKHKLISLLIGLLLFGLLLIGSSCVPDSVASQNSQVSQGSSIILTSEAVELQRYVDKEAGVVCWYFYLGGIDCMPIGDTFLSMPPW